MDPKQLALEHFEKVIALVAAGWLVMAMANYTSSPKELGLKDELQTKIDNINDYVAKHEPVKPKVPDWEARVKKSLGAEGAPEPQEFPGWVMHRRPNVVYKWKTVVFDQEPVHTPPTDLSLRPERGRITVTWSPSNQNALVTVTKYEVLRKVNDEKYAVVGEVEGETAEFADVNVNPRSRYWYKVRATAELDKEHPVVRKMIGRGVIKELKKELTVMESEESGPVKTPRTTIVIPTMVRMPTDDEIIEMGKQNKDASPKVTLKVYKWDADEKDEWASHTYYNIEVGQEIGAKERKKDFSTGGKLKSARIDKRPHPTIKGHTIPCYVIEIVYPDKSVETFNSVDRAPELKGVK